MVLFTRRSGAHLRIIDGGSGYLCEMEPVAHFGLGELEWRGGGHKTLPAPPGQGPALWPQHSRAPRDQLRERGEALSLPTPKAPP